MQIFENHTVILDKGEFFLGFTQGVSSARSQRGFLATWYILKNFLKFWGKSEEVTAYRCYNLSDNRN